MSGFGTELQTVEPDRGRVKIRWRIQAGKVLTWVLRCFMEPESPEPPPLPETEEQREDREKRERVSDILDYWYGLEVGERARLMTWFEKFPKREIPEIDYQEDRKRAQELQGIHDGL